MKTKIKNVQKEVISGLLATVLCAAILFLPVALAAPSSNMTASSGSSMIFVSNTTSDADGNFIFTDITDGNYVLSSVIYSSAMGGMWLTNVTEVNIENGQAVVALALSMRKNDDIDHEEILSALQTVTVSGKTISKTGEGRADVDIVLTLEDGSFYANTTSDENGNFILTGISDGNYVLKSVIYSTAMSGMWLTNVTSITVQDGLAIDDLSLSMRKNDDIDHEAILSMLDTISSMERTTISGRTISKTGEGRANVDMVLCKKVNSVLMPVMHTVGVYNNEGTWALWNIDTNSADIVGFGWPGTAPIVGDWDGDGVNEVGVYNTDGNNFLIQNDSEFDVIGLGWSGITPVVGDWNGDGADEVGVYNNAGTWALWNTDTNSADIFGFGWEGAQPIVGDWDGDGVTELGIYNTAGNNFLIQTDSGFDVIGLGWPGVVPVVGDWNGDGPDEVGVYNNEGTWALWNTRTNSADIVGFGWAGAEPVVGDWDGDGITEIAIYNTGGNNFLIQNDSEFDVIGLGWSGVTPVVGYWF